VGEKWPPREIIDMKLYVLVKTEAGGAELSCKNIP